MKIGFVDFVLQIFNKLTKININVLTTTYNILVKCWTLLSQYLSELN